MKKVLLAIGVFVIVSISANAGIFNVADLDKDGVVDFRDLAVMAENWLARTIFEEPDIEFAFIPAGTFLMGDESGGGGAHERPRHTVNLAAFELSKYEVTNYQYSRFLNTARVQGLIKVVDGVVYAADDTENARPHFTTTTADPASNISYGELIFGVITRDGQNMSDHPVTIVSWYGAKAFCEFYGWRLPTEAEWEYAARKGYDEYYAMYPWGDNTINASLCNYNGNVPAPRTTPVGRYPAYGYGLCDMAGNVFEWCSDWYAADYYASSPIKNPPGADTGVFRILRGGYYRTTGGGCRVAFRYKNTPVTRSYLGFRPARDIERNQ